MAWLLLALLASPPVQSGLLEEDKVRNGSHQSSIDKITEIDIRPNADAEYSAPDFSGAWAKDYARSDKWDQKLQLQINKMRSAAQKQSRSGRDSRSGPGAVISLNQGAGRGTNIIDLGRFAELITRSNDMFITQTDKEVRIKREGESDLICNGSAEPIKTSSNEFGSEVCSWQGHKLFFRISLPGRIEIYHRFEVSPERESINQQTKVSYGKHLSFDLVQFFNYYGPPDNDQFNCTQTLSRGKVCSRRKNTTASE